MGKSKLLALAIAVATMHLNAQAQAPDPSASSESLQIQYTGRLFGYYRIDPPADQAQERHFKPVETFLTLSRQKPEKLNPNEDRRPLLLGMGDNFAPEMGASLQLENPHTNCDLPEYKGSSHTHPLYPPESLYKDTERNALRAECDNVVRFLLRAGYRAIVPGREDFGYSAAWLHRIGNYIRHPKDGELRSDNTGQELTMLAANIRVTFGSGSKGVPCPMFLSDQFFSREELVNKNEKKAEEKNTAAETCIGEDHLPTRLNWLDRFDRVIGNSTIQNQVRKVARDQRGAYTLLENETRAMLSMLRSKDPAHPTDWAPFRGALSALAQKDSALQSPNPITADEYQAQLSLAKNAASTLNETLKLVLKEMPILTIQATPACNQKANSPNDLTPDQKKLSSAADQLSAIRASIENLPPGQLSKLKWERDLCAYAEAVVCHHLYDPKSKVPIEILPIDAISAGRDALLRAIASEQQDKGYTEAQVFDEGGHKKSVLIIGVVGQETMQGISMTDRQICLSLKGDHVKNEDMLVSCHDTPGSTKGTVTIINPTRTIQAILRASELVNGKYNYRILMAQMPQTEAIELVARLNASRKVDGEPVPQLDLALSEAQRLQVSPKLFLQYGRDGDSRWSTTPVLTPLPAYDDQLETLVRPDSIATLTTVQSTTTPQSNRSICNEPSGESPKVCTKLEPPTALQKAEEWDSPGDSALHLLMVAAEEAFQIAPHPDPRGRFAGVSLDENGNQKTLQSYDCETKLTHQRTREGKLRYDECKVSVIQFLLRSMQEAGHSDLAMLQRRDFFLNMLPDDYKDYEVCERFTKDPQKDPNKYAHCKLRMALDRVLWKGDYSERVMLTGKDIATMMSAASSQNKQEQGLLQTDLSQEWLSTFGIVTVPSSDLTRSRVSSDGFSIASDASCNDVQEKDHPSAGGNTLYCVNGLPLQPDHAYSVAITDYLDQNPSVVPKQPDDYYSRTGKFLTATLEKQIFDGVPAVRQPSTATNQPDHQPLPSSSQKVEIDHQQRGLFQLQIAKVVAGYSFRASPKGDNFIASAFQGATDSRASSPSQSELDIEAKERGIWRMKYFNWGIQSDSAYDRSVQGNLTGSPVNAAYPLNNATVGGFVEWKITSRGKHPQGSPAGILKLVLAPYQYQRQFNGNYLFFTHTDKTKPQEQTLHLPPVNGFSHRAGLRWWEEVSSGKWYRGDRGTYFEAGVQVTVLNDILSAVTLATPGTPPLTCGANASLTITNCFKAAFNNAGYPITGATTAASQQATLHSPGLYWDVHLQKTLLTLPDKSGPRVSLIIDSKGDSFFRRGASKTLSSQTLYDAPVSASLAFPVLRNFSLGPTYQVFLFGNQITAQHLFVNNFGLTARWFFDRDAAVGRPQFVFKGPASADETKTAHMK